VPQGILLGDVRDEFDRRHGADPEAFPNQATAGLPGRHDEEHGSGNQEWEPSSVGNLQEVCRSQGGFNQKHATGNEGRMETGPAKNPLTGKKEKQGGGHHGESDGDTVGSGQVVRVLETQDQPQTGDHECEIHLRHVDLPALMLRGVLDEQSWHVSELNGMHRQRVSARDQSL
jgi:hypothetical protein